MLLEFEGIFSFDKYNFEISVKVFLFCLFVCLFCFVFCLCLFACLFFAVVVCLCWFFGYSSMKTLFPCDNSLVLKLVRAVIYLIDNQKTENLVMHTVMDILLVKLLNWTFTFELSGAGESDVSHLIQDVRTHVSFESAPELPRD